MVTSVLNPDVQLAVEAQVIAPDYFIPTPNPGDRALPLPLNWASERVLGSYQNALNFALNGLGWVPQSIVDVGSGDGRLLSALGKQFFNITLNGIDPDPTWTAWAQKTQCCTMQFDTVGEGQSLPFENNSVDVVVSHGFLSHTHLPHHWLREMCRVSAEGLILSVVSPKAYKALRPVARWLAPELVGRPVLAESTQPISEIQLRYWLKREGFTVEAVASPLPMTLILARKASA